MFRQTERGPRGSDVLPGNKAAVRESAGRAAQFREQMTDAFSRCLPDRSPLFCGVFHESEAVPDEKGSLAH